MGVRRRLERLEARSEGSGLRRSLPEEALRLLPGADLDALEDEVEAAVARGERGFWDLFAVAGERSRRATNDLLDAIEAAEGGPGTPGDEPPVEGGALDLLEGIAAGDEEALRGWEGRNGYRIWKHYRKEKRSDEDRWR